MIDDQKTYRLYLEIMREAVLLDDRSLIEMVLMRIGNFYHSPTPTTKSNIISFPIGHIASAPAVKEEQSLWATVLRIAIIPLVMILIIVAHHYLALMVTIPCQS